MDDRLGVCHSFFINLDVLHRSRLDARHHTHQLLEVAHIFELRELLEVIIQGEGLLTHLLLKLCRLLFVVSRLCFVDKGEHVAHTEDTRCHTVGVEGLDGIEFFSHTHKLDGLACDVADGKCRTTSGIAIELGENNARNIEQVIKGFGNVDRFLTDH